MQIIYIHGFNSDATSVKGQWIAQYCQQHHPHIQVQRPDLNMPPHDVMQLLAELVSQDGQTAVIGSSLGGFFATAVAAIHQVPAVLINPSVRPFETMHKYISQDRATFSTKGGWQISADHFDHLHSYYFERLPDPSKVLVLLKTGDEVLDYTIAQDHYTNPEAPCTVIVEQGGDHFMQDMADKIPMMLAFIRAHWQMR